MRLADRRVLVIGASSGVGRASALAIALECDVRDEASCRAAIDRAVSA